MTVQRSIASVPWVRLSFFMGLCILPIGAWLLSVKNPVMYVQATMPAGQGLYVLSKLCGLLAIFMMWFQCVSALLARLMFDFKQASGGKRVHRLFGVATMVMVFAHALLFFLAASLRSGHTAWHLFLPRFTEGHYVTHVSIGAIALFLLALLVVAGIITYKRIVNLRWLHRLIIVVYGLAFWHSFAIGSETRVGFMKVAYWVMASVLVVLIFWRFLRWGVSQHAKVGAKNQEGLE